MPCLILPQVADRRDVHVGERPATFHDFSELAFQRGPQLWDNLPDAHARRRAERAFAHLGERTVDVPDPQGSVEKTKTDWGVFEHSVQERLAGAMLATPLDSDKAEPGKGQDETNHGQCTQQIV